MAVGPSEREQPDRGTGGGEAAPFPAPGGPASESTAHPATDVEVAATGVDGAASGGEVAGTDGEPAGAQTRPRAWAALVAGVVLVGCAVWSAATGWVGLTGSHPIGWITVVVAAAAGLGFLLWFVLVRRRDGVSSVRRWTVRLATGLAVVLLSVVVVYTRPLSAEQVALDALADSARVDVADAATSLSMRPADPARTGLVFYPGAKVDPRAYARLLRPVAEAGYPVVVAKQPYNLAVLDIGAADRWVGHDDDVDRWVVGGHSLGGAMAATYASTERSELVGLLLYAAFPADDLSGRELVVASVSGTHDGLATPDDIADSVDDLPAATAFVAIDGATHAYFGDYGTQRGDGEPGVDRDTAQREIVDATLALLERADETRSG